MNKNMKLTKLDLLTIECIIHNTIDKIEGIWGVSTTNPEKMVMKESKYYLELTKKVRELKC